MKLLLTSGGITNKSIANALFDLVCKKPEDTSLVFIPTASNVEKGDKGWFIDDLINLKKQNFKSIDIADISAIEEKIWKPKLEEADILFFEGGNTDHLMEWINKSGLVSLLPELLKTKVYVGLSAGSVVTNKDLALKISQIVYEEDLDKTENMAGLNLVDFYFLPHLNSPYFKKVRENNIREVTKGMKEKIYALDDNSALKVVDWREEFRIEKHADWVDFFWNKNESEYWDKTSCDEHWQNMVKQSEALWPDVVIKIKEVVNSGKSAIFEGVNILPHLARRDLNFEGIILLGESAEVVFERNKKDPRWGDTEELQRKEAEVFYNCEGPKYKDEAEKYGYKVFSDPKLAEAELLKLLGK